MNNKVTVIYRMIHKEVCAFLPDCPANPGNLVCYAHIGQHSEASMNYYRKGRLATPEEYQELHRELNDIYDGCLVIKKRLNYDKVRRMWQDYYYRLYN